MSTLTVIIPATDRPATLERVVQAVERAASPPEEVIVVDEPADLFSSAARNVGAHRASSEILVFVDADVEVHDDAFVRIRAAFDQDPALTAIFGAYDDNPASGSLLSDFRNLLHHYVHREGAGVATTFWTGLGAIRREAFLEVGGFDETVAWIRDIELGARLRRAGAVIMLEPSIQGAHLKRWTLRSMLHTDIFRRGVPWLRLILEGRADSTALNLGSRHRIGTGASVVLVGALARRNLRVAAAALAVLPLVDHEFYGLLLRRGGRRLLAAGVPLLILHRLAGVAAVPLAVTHHFLDNRRRARR